MGYVIRFLILRNTSLSMIAMVPPTEHWPMSVITSKGTTFAPYSMSVARAYPLIMIIAPGMILFILSLVLKGVFFAERYDIIRASENFMANVNGAHRGYPSRRSASDEPIPADRDAIAGGKLSATKYIMASPKLKYILVEGIGKYTNVASVVRAVNVAVIAMFLVCCCMNDLLIYSVYSACEPFYMNIARVSRGIE